MIPAMLNMIQKWFGKWKKEELPTREGIMKYWILTTYGNNTLAYK